MPLPTLPVCISLDSFARQAARELDCNWEILRCWIDSRVNFGRAPHSGRSLSSRPAQTALPQTQPSITLDEALARTLDANPALAANGYQIDAALSRVQQANIGPTPVFDLAINDALGTDDFRGVRSAETTLSIIWVLERGTRLRQIDAALADVSLHEVEARIMQLDTAAETARRFLACLALQARLVNAAEAIRLAEQAVESVRARVAAGGATQAEQSRAEAGLVRAQLLEEDYEHELVSANHRLSEQWGETQPDFGRALGDVQGASGRGAAGNAPVTGGPQPRYYVLHVPASAWPKRNCTWRRHAAGRTGNSAPAFAASRQPTTLR